MCAKTDTTVAAAIASNYINGGIIAEFVTFSGTTRNVGAEEDTSKGLRLSLL